MSFQVQLARLINRQRGTAFLLAWTLVVLGFVGGSFSAAGAVPASTRAHPLDPPNAAEIRAAVALLGTDGGFDFGKDRLVYLGLDPTLKPEIQGWGADGPPLRRFEAVVLHEGTLHSGRIDLATRRLLDWAELPGAHPRLLHDEMVGIEHLLMQDERFRVGAVRRGIRTAHQLTCITSGPGGVAPSSLGEVRGERLLRAVCYQRQGHGSLWSRPLAGLAALVAPARQAVLEVFDDGSGLPTQPSPQQAAEAGGVAEIPWDVNGGVEPFQNSNSLIRLAGHQVEWAGWRLRWGFDPRVGLTVQMVSIQDGRERRSVLYQGNVSELFVPYMDPSPDWAFRAYLDAGEFGLGRNVASLAVGTDCPETAHYLPVVLADDRGTPHTVERAVCLFERKLGDAAWRHTEAITGQAGGAPSAELVVRWVAAIGNYDYTFDWRFRRDGSIEVAVGSSGIVQVQRTAPPADADASLTPHGRPVAPGLVAIHHSHFLSYRLDLDVDGPRNSFLLSRWLPAQAAPKSTQNPEPGQRSVWTVQETLLARESQAQLDVDLRSPASWRVVNPERRNAFGNPSGYQLRPGAVAYSLLAPGDPLLQRAGFVAHQLWVTPFSPQESYAAGRFPIQASGPTGLPAAGLRTAGLETWTAADRALTGSDLVLWHTVGFHHLVRTEDWPVMPTMWTSFELRPFDFFAANPLLIESAEAVSP